MNRRNEELARVGEARNLLEMLEYLFADIAARQESGKLPWPGMKITLERVSESLFELEQIMRQSPAPSIKVETQDGVPVDSRDGAANAGRLAGRIQMAPTPRSGRRGYSREIVSGDNSDSQDSVGAE